MKVGLVTINDMTNYGNRLQNYALSYVLSQQKIKCKSVVIKDINFKSKLKSIKQIMKRIAIFVLGDNLCKIRPFSIRYSNFEDFTEKNIPEKICISNDYKIPINLDEEFEYFIVGSDQVWNPTFWNKKNERNIFNNYMLSFASNEKKISFSASFGISNLPDKWKKDFARELSKFKAISVREEAGAKIVKELTGCDAEVLIDPTMMLTKDEWRKVAKKSRFREGKNKPYILTYFLGNQSSERENYIKEIARKNGLEIYNLMDKKNPVLYSSGPDEFIDLIDNANLICTDSFHATVFSILFNKPFLIMDREQSGMENMNSRITTLLSKLHLENRMPNRVSEKDIFECNYDEAYNVLKVEREKAYEFLGESLEL